MLYCIFITHLGFIKKDDTCSYCEYCFSSIKELKEVILHDAISKHYETTIIKSNLMRYIIMYSNDTCKWRLYVSQSQLACTSEYVI